MSKTVKIRNVSPFGDLDVPALRRIVKANEVIELPAEEAERYLLIESDWHEVGAPRKSTTKSSDDAGE